MTSSTSSATTVFTSTSGAASISGLASGIDTTSLITSLMAVEATTQTNLKTKLTTNQSTTGVLQGINTKLAALTTSASKFSTGAASNVAKATVTLPSTATTTVAPISATVSGTPTLGSLSVSAATLATAQSAEFFGAGNASLGWSAATTGAKSIQLTANGVTTTVTPASYLPADVASAINSSDAGVSANVITDANGSHLILTAKPGDYTGTSIPAADRGFSLQYATATDGGGVNTYTTAARAVADLTPAADASITVNGITKTGHSNTFTDVIAGLDLTVATSFAGGGASSPVTVTTTQDTSSVSSSVSTLVTSLADVLADIKLALTRPSSSSGLKASATNGGLLAGDSTLRGVQQALLDAVSGGSASSFVAGRNPEDAGISVDANGVVSVDPDVLTKFLTKNPTIAQSVLTNFGTALSSASSTASTASIGTVSKMITDLQSSATTLSTSISDWDDRLALRKKTLTAQYTAMETALSKLQNQSTALTQALKNINGSSDD